MVDFVAENPPNPMFQMGPQAKSALGISPAPTDLGKYGQNAPALLAKKNAEVDQQIAAKEAERTAATKPLSEGAQQSRQALEKTLEAGPKTESMPEKTKFTPTDVQQNMGVLMALAALSGAVSRQPLTASLNAMAGMIQGVREGDEARFQRSYKEYDQNLRGVIEKNRQYENEFNRIVKSRETSISEKTEQLRLLNLQFDRQVAQVAAQKQDYKGVVDLGMRVQKLTSDAENRRLQLQQMAEARQQAHEDRQKALESRAWREYQSADGTINRVNLATGEHEAIGGTAGLTKLTGKGGAAGAGGNGKGLSAMQSTMYQDVATAHFRLGELEKMTAEAGGKLPGASPEFLALMHSDGWISAVKNYGLHGLVPPDMQKTDAILLGLAFDVASARSGGRGQLSDSKIKEVRTQFPIGSEPESTKEWKYRAILNQIEEANKTLPAQFRYDRAKRGPAGDATPAAPTPQAGPQIGAIEDGHRFKGGDPSKQENWEVVK